MRKSAAHETGQAPRFSALADETWISAIAAYKKDMRNYGDRVKEGKEPNAAAAKAPKKAVPKKAN